MQPTAVFLHSGFRSGSTWFWSCFRDCADVYAYCEPFNVRLATLTAEAVAANRPDAWRSGHPPLRQPYFAEFLPLIKDAGGVEGFDPKFAIESYYRHEPDPAAERYIAALVAEADRRRKIPVLGFCCSLGRVGWFKRFVRGLNVVTWRNPRDQWCSSHAQWTGEGNFHFEVHYLLVAYVGSLYPEITPFLRGLPPIPVPTEVVPNMPLFATPQGVANRFRIFLRIFTLDMLLAIQNADTVIDLDALSGDAAYRNNMTQILRRETGIAGLSFENCSLPQHRFRDDADYATLMMEGLDWIDTLERSPWGKVFAASLPFVRDRFLQALDAGSEAPAA